MLQLEMEGEHVYLLDQTLIPTHPEDNKKRRQQSYLSDHLMDYQYLYKQIETLQDLYLVIDSHLQIVWEFMTEIDHQVLQFSEMIDMDINWSENLISVNNIDEDITMAVKYERIFKSVETSMQRLERHLFILNATNRGIPDEITNIISEITETVFRLKEDMNSDIRKPNRKGVLELVQTLYHLTDLRKHLHTINNNTRNISNIMVLYQKVQNSLEKAKTSVISKKDSYNRFNDVTYTVRKRLKELKMAHFNLDKFTARKDIQGFKTVIKNQIYEIRKFMKGNRTLNDLFDSVNNRNLHLSKSRHLLESIHSKIWTYFKHFHSELSDIVYTYVNSLIDLNLILDENLFQSLLQNQRLLQRPLLRHFNDRQKVSPIDVSSYITDNSSHSLLYVINNYLWNSLYSEDLDDISVKLEHHMDQLEVESFSFIKIVKRLQRSERNSNQTR